MNTLRLLLCCIVLGSAGAVHALELVTEDDPPHNMLKDGKVIGIATEKLEEAFRRSAIAQRIELMPWARAYQAALTQPGVCVYSAARTTERETLFKWVGPIAAMDWVLYAPAGRSARPAKLEDVRQQMIGGYLQDVISVWLATQGYRVDTATSDASNPKKLLAGRIDYWASSRPRATALLAQENAGASIVPVLTFGHTDLYLACHRSVADDTVRQLNDALAKMKADGSAARIEARYARWPAQ